MLCNVRLQRTCCSESRKPRCSVQMMLASQHTRQTVICQLDEHTVGFSHDARTFRMAACFSTSAFALAASSRRVAFGTGSGTPMPCGQHTIVSLDMP